MSQRIPRIIKIWAGAQEDLEYSAPARERDDVYDTQDLGASLRILRIIRT